MNLKLSILFLMYTCYFSSQNINIDSLKSVIKEEIKAELKEQNKNENSSSLLQWSKFSIKGYGVVNYYNYGRYDTDKGIRDKIDAERLNLYLDYHFSDKWLLHTEFEFEHGGTGTTIELDTQEEFGEYEKEIEKGGEVRLEQVNLEYRFKPYLNFKVGRLKVLFNLAQKLDDPDEYFTTHRPEMEDAILPLGWYENGVSFFGSFWKNRLSYNVSVVNGLESSAFSSANWVKWGYQTKFEMVNAENFALFANVDYHFGKNKHTFTGISYYTGNTTDNRPKPDLAVPGKVVIYGVHLSYFEHPFRFASQFIYGDLQNSERISVRNVNQPAALGTKKTPVAKNAIGFSAELGYDIMTLFASSAPKMKLYPFVRYDYYDTMYKTAGSIKDNKRWERSAITGGFNWFIFPKVIWKIQYSSRTLGSDNVDITTNIINGKQMENTFSTGIGFNF